MTDATPPKRTCRVRIRGRVQGVWFRAWTAQEAQKRGLDGWVRNRRDGSVEAVFSGDPALVENMISACWSGPRMAEVTGVDSGEHDEPVPPGFVTRDNA